jgi:hypothetical protein
MYIPFRKEALRTRPYMTGEMVFFSYSLEAYGLELVSIYVYLPKEYGYIHVYNDYETVHVYRKYEYIHVHTEYEYIHVGREHVEGNHQHRRREP